MLKLLIDECLSPELAVMARERGHPEASHIVWMGKAGWKDWQLKQVILNEDWTFVTRNSNDFRGPVETPGSSGQLEGVPLHAGLVCLNHAGSFDLTVQRELFAEALRELESVGDLINQVIEVTLSEDLASIEVTRYDLPSLERASLSSGA